MRFRRKFSEGMIVALVALFCCVVPARAQENPFKITFELESSTISLGEPVLVKFTVTNTSPKVVHLDLGADKIGNFMISIVGPLGPKNGGVRAGELRHTSCDLPDGSTCHTGLTVYPNDTYSVVLLLSDWKFFPWHNFDADPDTLVGAYRVAIGLNSLAQVDDDVYLIPPTLLVFEVTPRDPAKFRARCEELVNKILVLKPEQDDLIFTTTRAVSKMRSEAAVPCLERAMRKLPSSAGDMIYSLREIGSREAVAALIRGLKTVSTDNREWIRKALVELKSKAEPPVKEEIEQALGKQ